MKGTRNLPVLVTIVILGILAMTGCQADHGLVPDSPEGTYTAEGFVDYFNMEKTDNQHRVSDWVEDGKVFRLRLADIKVGDGTVTYKTGRVPFASNRTNLHVECSFDDKRATRTINNGDTVDLTGRTTEISRGWQRITLKLNRCSVAVVQVENG